MQMWRALLGLMLFGGAAAAQPALALPAGVPDYAGANVANFLQKTAAMPGGAQDYVLPPIDAAKAFVVDAAGIGGAASDDNPGTVQKPFRTIARALRELKPGAIIVLRQGTYNITETLRIDAGQMGTREQPAVIAAYPGESAVLDGAQSVAGWTQLPNSKTWYHDLEAAPGAEPALWLGDRQLPPIRRYMVAMAVAGAPTDRTTKPLDGAEPIGMPGAWALAGQRLFLRAPDDADPNKLPIAFAAHPGFELHHTQWLVFYRLTLRRMSQAVLSITNPNVAWRECVFDRCGMGVTYFGGDAAERGFIDRCLFHHTGDGTRGESIYTTSPMTIRHSLFVDNAPLISISAYTSKDDMFTGLQVVGNTFVHGGACITSTGKGSVIRDNIALGSRFVSSAGTAAVIENNFAVYDAKDLIDFPATPRRNVGFRLYGSGSRLKGNTFVGFHQGGLILKPEKPPVEMLAIEAMDNAFYQYADYGLRIYDPDHLRSDRNLFAPAGTPQGVIYLTPSQDDKHVLTLAQWQAKGFDANSRLDAAAPQPAIPPVLRDAM